jgi:lipopolysaccharide transport system ATP-binding protein
LPLSAAFRNAREFLGTETSASVEGYGRPWALRDLNAVVRRGETVGIVGRNGAGKSTLLKILAGVCSPTRGRVTIHGRVFPMIELNAGLNKELTGRENVRLLGAIMGLTRRDIQSRLPEIEDFTELGEWFDRPVRTYSSGMLARLGFGVAVNVESDIILVDETFAVGDLKFQNKSLERMKQIQQGGATFVLVSHSLDTLQFMARRGILMDKGRIVSEGSTLEAINAYEKLVFSSENEQVELRARSRISSEEVTIYGARIYTENGQTIHDVTSGNPFGIEVDLRLGRLLKFPMFSIGLHNHDGVLCKWNISLEDGLSERGSTGRFLVRAWYPENYLGNGTYEIHFATRDGASFETLERIAGLLTFDVKGAKQSKGIVVGRCRWEMIPHQPSCPS